QHIQALLQMSFNSLYQGHFEQAETEANDVLKLAKENKMNDLATKGLAALGSISYFNSQQNQAEAYFNQAIDFAGSYEGQYSRALVLGNRCALYIGNGIRLDECLKEIEQARAFFESGGYLSEELQASLIQARANRKTGNSEAARKAYETVIPLSSKLNDKYNEAIARSEFGQLLMEQSQFNEALDQFNQRYAISKALGQQQGLVYALIYRAEALHHLGKVEESKRDIDDAKAITSKLPTSQQKALQQAIVELQSKLALKLQPNLRNEKRHN
ncbi:MAG: hypothetical protein ACRD82_19675, partial [Blastocatellia bacterium]